MPKRYPSEFRRRALDPFWGLRYDPPRGPLLRPGGGGRSALGLGDAHALTQAIVQYSAAPDTSCLSYELCCSPAVRPYEATDPGCQRMMAAGTVQARPEERWRPPAEG